LIVRGTGWPSGRQLARERVALQAEHVHRHYLEQPGIGGTVRRVTTAATLGFHRYMLVDERSLLVDVALVANGISAWQGAHLADSSSPVRVMAVTALD
jgi:hypothetical protein